MSGKQLNPSQYNLNFLSKTSSTQSCQNLLCLTKRCNQDQSKDKQRILNYQYFEKLSLKKFNNSTFVNQSYYQKDKGHQRSLKRDKSTEDSEFQNIVINTNKQDQLKYSNKNISEPKQQSYFEQNQRIARCSSHRQLEKPQPNNAERQISKEIQQDFRKIEDLQRLSNRLEAEICSLDQNIDKYYLIYNSKLQQLKNIKSRMNEIGDSERIVKKIPSNNDLKGFRKKFMWDELNGNKFGANQKKQDNTPAFYYHMTFNTQRKHPSVYKPKNKISFVKKAF